MSGYPPHVLYEQQLASVGFGTPLWNPIPDDGHVKIGDVGFMTDGSFSRLLRATASSPAQLEELGDLAPAGFEELQLSESDFRMKTRIAYPIYSTTVASYGVSGGASAGSVPVSEVAGSSINFEFSQGKCALFLTRYDNFCQNTIQHRTLKDYVKKHYMSWVDLAQNRGYGDVHPMLVSGFDSSLDFAMMTYAASDNKLSASVTVNVPNFASLWGNGWATCTTRGSPHYNCGPRFLQSINRRLEQESRSAAQPVPILRDSLATILNILRLRSTESQESPSEPAAQPAQNRYVTFVRGWHMSYRFFIFPKLKAAAEPKDLDPGDPDPNAWAEVVSNVQSENIDPFDVVFKFLFQNSTADYALVHDDDLQPISEIAYRNKESIEHVLARCPPSVVLMDDDDVASFTLEHLVSWSKKEIALSESIGTHQDRLPEVLSDAQQSASISEIVDQDSAFGSKYVFIELLKLIDENPIAAINAIDTTLSSDDLSDDLRRRYLALLRMLCGKCLTLPRTRMLSQDLVRIGDSPRASGGFTDVWKGKYKEKKVAIKVFKTYAGNDPRSNVKKQLFEEAAIWCHLQHENILSFIGVAVGSNFCLVYPWMINGNINEYVRNHPEADRLPLVKDILEGLKYLHSENIVHGNLKGENILINDNGRACLVDFGLASIFASRDILLEDELVRRRVLPLGKITPTIKNDIFVIGMVIYEIITEGLPLYSDAVDPSFTSEQININSQLPQRPDDATFKFVKPLWPIAEMCWVQEPMERPNVDQVLVRLEEEIRYWQTRDETQTEAYVDRRTTRLANLDSRRDTKRKQ